MPFCYSNISLCSNINIEHLNNSLLRVVADDEILSETVRLNNLVLKLSSPLHNNANSLRGSLHTACKGNNRGVFKLSDLEVFVSNLERDLNVKASECEIHSLELQINIFLDEPIHNWIKSVMTHKGKPFVPINRRHVNLGRYVGYDDREIKLYDKYLSDILDAKNKAQKDEIKAYTPNKNILRFGVKVLKMRFLKKYGIKTLSDLIDPVKAIALTSVLYNEIAYMRFYDFNADLSLLSANQSSDYKLFSNPYYLHYMDYRERENAVNRYNRLTNKCKAHDFNGELIKLCFDAYLKIFEAEDLKKCRYLHLLKQALKNSEAQKMSVFTYLVSYVQSPLCDNMADTIPKHKKELKNNSQKHVLCCSCGRDISHQRKGSKFCSEKHYSKEAKQCRNKANNKVRADRIKLIRKKEWELIAKLKKETDFSLVVTVRTSAGTKNLRPKVNKLLYWDNKQVLKIKSIKVVRRGMLTTLRAKYFIRHLIKSM